MHIFLDNFNHGGKYTSQIAIPKWGNVYWPKSLSISYLHIDNLHLESSSGSGRKNEGENLVQKKFAFCGSANVSAKQNQKDNRG